MPAEAVKDKEGEEEEEEEEEEDYPGHIFYLRPAASQESRESPSVPRRART